YPYAARTGYRGQYPGRRYYGGGRFYSPYAYRRWPWLYRRYYGYGAPAYEPQVYAPPVAAALPPAPGAEPTPTAAPSAAPTAPMAEPGAPMGAPGAPMAGPPEPSGSPWILLVQSCLRKILGPDAAPMNGRLGHGTRRALRQFQQQNSLPPTG